MNRSQTHNHHSYFEENQVEDARRGIFKELTRTFWIGPSVRLIGRLGSRFKVTRLFVSRHTQFRLDNGPAPSTQKHSNLSKKKQQSCVPCYCLLSWRLSFVL
jgi:hypothetical protein